VYSPALEKRWELVGGVLDQSARESPYSFLQPMVGAKYVREWAGGWITGVGAYSSVGLYVAPDPIFGLVRHDRETRVEADIANRRFRYYKFTPRIQIGNTNHKSNVDMYSYQRAYLRIGMTADF